MECSATRDGGFTLVELMVVVLIIGILVSIAIPVYSSATANAYARSCQANQRTIISAIEVGRSADANFGTASAGELIAGGSGWYALLVPSWIRSKPTCPMGHDNYYLSAAGDILGDSGAVQVFKDDHKSL